jgi:3-dehydro-L-gulonate 2-dehydrogenase
MARIPLNQLVTHLAGLFERAGVPPARARRLAELYATASADGVFSHGVHFVPSVLRWLGDKTIAEVSRDPQLIDMFGAIERYDGHLGLGALNAEFCMNRAMVIADAHGVGCVALCRTTHWGRPGNFGWMAAERNYLAICWTNTPANMAVWGGDGVKAVGNNPIVFAAPGKDGRHLVLDMAMSQFSYGRLDTHRAERRPLPVVGGVDSSGHETTDAAAILNGGSVWPIGFWKGSGLAIALDIFAAILSGGQATADLTPGAGDAGASQVFIAFSPQHLQRSTTAAGDRTAQILDALAATSSASRYPGRAALEHRKQSAIEGVYVRDDLWASLQG